MRRMLVVVAALMPLLVPAAAPAMVKGDRPCSKKCVERVKKRIVQMQRREEWRDYRRNPMPFCTWGPESSWSPQTGESFHGRPWARGRYRVVNPDSGAGGKFQVMPGTWAAYGGAAYASRAELASRLHQERVARRIAWAGTVRHAPQGLAAWVRC